MHKIMIPVVEYTTIGEQINLWTIYAADLEDEAIKFTEDDRVSIRSMIKEMEDYLEFERFLNYHRTPEIIDQIEVIKHRKEALEKLSQVLDYVHVNKNYRRYYISFED